MGNIINMSPFWKNVTEELEFNGMNFKTLAFLTGIPYSTITNGKNRPDSIPTADVALKISKVLNKPLEQLLGEEKSIPKNDAILIHDKQQQELQLFQKYKQLIESLEKYSSKKQNAVMRLFAILAEDE